MNTKSQYWIDTAQYDIDSAKAMLDAKRYLYVGFMCHLAIEKALKAIISRDENADIPKIHNLIRLANVGNVGEKLTNEQKGLLGILNPLNLEARYPLYKDGVYKMLGDAECKKIILDTEALYLWIKQQL